MTEEEVRLFLRKGKNGGLYFFNKAGTKIYFMDSARVKELIEDKRPYVVITGRPAERRE